MRNPDIIGSRIFSQEGLIRRVAQWRLLGKTVAFTNGCFDILHEGHIFSLSQAAREADYLVVAVNADESVKKLKGPARPVNPEHSRALVIASLVMVDAVIIFTEDTPVNLITRIRPDVLVKGGDYKPEQIVGAKEVLESGGRVVINPILEGFSTSAIITRINQPG